MGPQRADGAMTLSGYSLLTERTVHFHSCLHNIPCTRGGSERAHPCAGTTVDLALECLPLDNEHRLLVCQAGRGASRILPDCGEGYDWKFLELIAQRREPF
jgi:hypothetical protein